MCRNEATTGAACDWSKLARQMLTSAFTPKLSWNLTKGIVFVLLYVTRKCCQLGNKCNVLLILCVILRVC